MPRRRLHALDEIGSLDDPINVCRGEKFVSLPYSFFSLSMKRSVKASMNEINASRRLKEAASHKAEADKVRKITGDCGHAGP